MRVRLLDPDLDVDLDEEAPDHAADVVADLGIATLVEEMAGGDRLVADISLAVLVRSAGTRTVRYRQAVLADFLRSPTLAEELAEVGAEALAKERAERYGILGRGPASVLGRSVRLLGALLDSLRDLRSVAERHAGAARSEGLRSLLETIRAELADGYLGEVSEHLRRLELAEGVTVGLRSGPGGAGVDPVLHRPPERKSGLRDRIPGRGGAHYTVTVADRDEAGGRILGEIRDRSLAEVAEITREAVEHLLGFFARLRNEVTFYLGCIRLEARLRDIGQPVVLPDARGAEELALSAEGLYDISLALHLDRPVVGNDLDADGVSLVVVTGANQGGKSTFLRSVGTAMAMAGAGMFVGARSCRVSIPAAVLTHYRREEEAGLEHGKFDEELARMSALVDRLRPGAILLSNESFAATNEREGSEIAQQVLRALVDSGVRVVAVTHLVELARRLCQTEDPATLSLRAERLDDGTRTFRLVEAPPLPTSFGEDLWGRVFGPADTAAGPEIAATTPTGGHP